MQHEQSDKQKIVDLLKKSTNILVTVNRDPSVDALSAALGLTLMLNKMDKHATAVYSGKTPAAIDFLNPGKTFENTTDSLRDFIISLDKEKADRLRYKVEDDVVRIYITPYRTLINQNDLQFSQGDFNIDLVLALGVSRKEELDDAIAAHGRILHDAPVATMNLAKTERNESLGEINWIDDESSSLSEMLMGLTDSLKPGILDEQISTAVLTGLVASTGRFSNNNTTPRIMNMAATLMAAGANQQLVADKLEQEIRAEEWAQPTPNSDGSQNLPEGTLASVRAEQEGDGEMSITHVPEAPVAATPTTSQSPVESSDHQLINIAPGIPPIPPQPSFDEPINMNDTSAYAVPPEQPYASSVPEGVIEPAAYQDESPSDNSPWSPTPAPAAPYVPEPAVTPAPLPALPPTPAPTSPTKSTQPSPDTKIVTDKKGDWRADPEPTFGGTLNATTDEAAEESRASLLNQRNHQLLSHDSGAASGLSEDEDEDGEQPNVSFDNQNFQDAQMHHTVIQSLPPEPQTPALTSDASSATTPTVSNWNDFISTFPNQPDTRPVSESEADTEASIDQLLANARAQSTPVLPTSPFDQPVNNANAPVDDARSAVEAALEFRTQPPADSALHHDAPMAQAAPIPTMSSPMPPAPAGLPPLPPLPDFSTLPPLPGAHSTGAGTSMGPGMTINPSASPSAASGTSRDPSSFSLPGM